MSKAPTQTSVVATTDEMELVLRDRYENRSGELIQHAKTILSQRAVICLSLIEKWGMVAAVPDGEDSSGRQRLRPMTPEEMVARACDTSDLAMTEFELRGWRTVLPSYAEIHGPPSEA